MAQIFISHSSRDRELVSLFERAASTTNVRLVLEELESLKWGPANQTRIANNISQSNAVFVLLGANVNDLPHTRDWVAWEAGQASAKNKDIWVFEPAEDRGRVAVVIPQLRHYVVSVGSDLFVRYLMGIVESYDDSGIPAAALIFGGLGAAVGGGPGAALGAYGGYQIADKSGIRPTGLPLSCPKCRSTYSVHLPHGTLNYRCPVCNSGLRLPEIVTQRMNGGAMQS